MSASRTCPCCGGPLPDSVTPAEELAAELGANLFSRIVEKLAERPGRWVRRKAIFDYVYQDDPNGGPEDAANTVSVTLSRRASHERLARLGWRIESGFKLGSFSGYRLVLAERDAP